MGKLNPTTLAGILERLPKYETANLLVGIDTMDDAGVFQISSNMALVQTVDFFYPVVNDPRAFGRIVAANSLSDIWAMGAKAMTAMNLLSYPAGKIDVSGIEELLAGGSEKLTEANVALVGGHTMEQEDLVYGMSVTGVVSPDAVVTNSRARVGDVLLLTKPLGTGVYSNALKEEGMLPANDYAAFVGSMERLNMYAASILSKFDVSAITDVTGFGLLGHALPMARNGGVSLVIESGKVPHLPDIFEYLSRYYPLGVCKCKEYVMAATNCASAVTDAAMSLLSEAQTSGGLLVAIRAGQVSEAVAALHECGDPYTAIIGYVKEGPGSPDGEYLIIT